MHKILKKYKVSKLELLKRAEQITQVFLKYGLDFVLKAMRHHYFSRHYLKKKIKQLDKAILYSNIRKALEELGGAFIKFGQMLSLRPDILPKELCLELSNLQDSTVRVDYEQIKTIIETSLGKKIDTIFSSFKKTPIASASIAQVHLATLKSNKRKVAVKVKKPNVDQTFIDDIKLLYFIAKKLNRYVDYDLIHLVREFEEYTIRELNFRLELYNMIKLKHLLKQESYIIIPSPYPEFCSDSVLVMDFIEGTELKNITKLKLSSKDRELIIRNLLLSLLKQVFIYRFFHADLHPSNIIITKNKKITYVDFGIVGELSEELRDILLELMLAIIELDIDGICQAIKKLGKVPENFNDHEFRDKIRNIVISHQKLSIQDMRIGLMGYEIFCLARQFGIVMRQDLLLYAKTFLTIEGTIIEIWPDINIISLTESELKKLESQIYDIMIEDKVKNRLRDMKTYLSNIMLYSEKTLKNLAQGNINVRIETKEFLSILDSINREITLIDLGLIASSLIIAGSILLLTRTSLRYQVNLFSFLCFILAIFFIILMFLRQRIISKFITRFIKS